MSQLISQKSISSGEQRRRQKAIRTAVRSTQFEGHNVSVILEQDLTQWAAGETALDQVYQRLKRTHNRKELIDD
jgi:hypothetical protein